MMRFGDDYDPSTNDGGAVSTSGGSPGDAVVLSFAARMMKALWASALLAVAPMLRGSFGRMGKRGGAPLALAVVALVAGPIAPSGASGEVDARVRASELGLSCVDARSAEWSPAPDDEFVRCTGEIPSFDGVPLDVTLTLPKATDGGRLPLVLQLGGWPGHKFDAQTADYGKWWPSAWHWNNVWFASRGYASLTYTARGFFESCGTKDPDPRCERAHTHIADAAAELRDSQHLLGKLVDARIAEPGAIVATGESYGGGQTWMLATSGPWRSPAGHPVKLAGAIPVTSWTDLHGSLLPNGRANDEGRPRDFSAEPIGVFKQAITSGFHAAGRAPEAYGRYSSDSTDKSSYFDGAFATWSAGEPYGDEARAYEQAWRTKSALFNDRFFSGLQAGIVDPVPVLAISGWFDPLFPAVESLQMYRKLLAADPDYPISLAFADVGHERPVGPPQWQQIFTHANAFLDKIVAGGVPSGDVRSLSASCPKQDETPDASWTVAPSWDAIRTDRLELSAKTTGSSASSTSSAVAKPCEDQQRTPGSAVWSWDVPGADGVTMLGLPTVKVAYQITGSDATVIARLWDVAEDGVRRFVSRGVYRLSSGDSLGTSQGSLEFQLFGNHWHFAPGHDIELELTQSEAPALRPDNLPSAITYERPSLTLPLGAR